MPPLWGRSEPPRHDGVRQHPSSPGLRNNRGLELGPDPAGARAEFGDDAARSTRAGALGAILVPLSAPDACLRLQRCAPSPPSGGLDENRVAEIQQGRPDPNLARDQPHPLPSRRNLNRSEPPQAAPDTRRTQFQRGQEWCDQGIGVRDSWRERVPEVRAREALMGRSRRRASTRGARLVPGIQG